MQSLILAVILDLISVGLAIFATFLAIRINKASVKEHQERARELEIFAGRVAHDLKNPLGSIMLGSSLAERQNLSADTREVVERISMTSKRMNQLIDGLLDFARSGAHPETGAKADLGAIIDHLLAGMSLDAEQPRRPHGSQQLFPSACDALACSEGVLSSIFCKSSSATLSNILLMEFTRRAKLPFASKILRNIVRVEIEDNGPGIAPSHLKAIFEPYFRVHNSGHPGIGLGLATVKRLVEAHDGKLGVASTVGRGSCFWLPELPKPGLTG